MVNMIEFDPCYDYGGSCSNDDDEDSELSSAHEDKGESTETSLKANGVKDVTLKGAPQSGVTAKLAAPKRTLPAGTKVTNTKKAKLDAQRSRHQPPTSEEFMNLEETSTQLKYSLFKLQVDEVLNEAKLGGAVIAVMVEWVSNLKELLCRLPEETVHLTRETTRIGSVMIPMDFQPFSIEGSHCLRPPTKVTTLGSVELGTALADDSCIDVAVVIPAVLLVKHCHRRQKFFQLRSVYLAYLANQLVQSEQIDGVESLSFQRDCCRHARPTLLIRASRGGRTFTVKLGAVMKRNLFTGSRFHVGKDGLSEAASHNDDNDWPGATPLYNLLLMEELCFLKVDEFCSERLRGKINATEAIVLLKVWARQRHLHHFGGLTGFFLNLLVIHLLQIGYIRESHLPHKCFSLVISFLASNPLHKTSMRLGSDPAHPDAPSAEEHRLHCPVVLLDQSGFANLASGILDATAERIREEAELSWSELQRETASNVPALFLVRKDFLTSHDCTIRISDDEKFFAIATSRGDDAAEQFCGDPRPAALAAVVNILQMALLDRVRLLSVELPAPQKWFCNEGAPSLPLTVTIGLLLNDSESLRAVEQGPSADEPEAEYFRRFWGDKSELRRFHDGTVCEAVVWPAGSFAERRQIVGRIVRHIAAHHWNFPDGSVVVLCGQLDGMLRQNAGRLLRTGEEAHLMVQQSFDHLSRQLRSLKGLPLAIHSVLGVDPSLRHTQIFPPNPIITRGFTCFPTEEDTPFLCQSMQVLIKMEDAPRWPDDLEALRRLKSGLLLEICRALSRLPGLTCQPFPEHLLVFKNGFVFRLAIGCNREIGLLKTAKQDGVTRVRDTAESLEMERQLIQLPKLSSSLQSLHQQSAAFSASVALCKRWVMAQLFYGHLSDHAVELLVASLFLHPAPFSPPRSPLTSFLQFVELLIRHNWAGQPLLVDINSEFKDGDHAQVQRNFEKDRAMLPAMVLATPLDKFCSHATRSGPSAMMLTRLLGAARATREALDTLLWEKESCLEKVFLPPLTDYHMLIHLLPQHVPLRQLSVAGCGLPSLPRKRGRVDHTEARNFPVVDFNPPLIFLRELKENFAEFGLFFYDPCGGDKIAVLWKPVATKPQKAVLSNMKFREPIGRDPRVLEKVAFSEEIAIEEITMIGAGLIKEIQILKNL